MPPEIFGYFHVLRQHRVQSEALSCSTFVADILHEDLWEQTCQKSGGGGHISPSHTHPHIQSSHLPGALIKYLCTHTP